MAEYPKVDDPCVVADPSAPDAAPARAAGSGGRWLAARDAATPPAPTGVEGQELDGDWDDGGVGPLPIEEATRRALTEDRDRAAAAAPDADSVRRRPAPQEPLRSSPVRSRTVDGLHHVLGVAFRAGAAGNGDSDLVDVETAVQGAVTLCAAAPGEGPAVVARQAGEVVAAMTELALPEAAGRPVNWAGFGALIPVLSGSPGAGASVVAAALTDALQSAGRCTLLVDAADPARSGLAGAAATEGPWAHSPHRKLTIRYSWREHALVARLESSLPMITPGMVPPPPTWLPRLDPLHVTVVDIGHDGWRAAADPLVGAGGWLRYGTPAQRPLLVVRPTRPSLQLAEQVLARLDPWIAAGVAVAPFAMVVVGAKRWPAGVAGAAGHRVARLVEDAVFLPHDQHVEAAGVTDALLPDRLQDAVSPLLAQWGLIPPTRSRKGHR